MAVHRCRSLPRLKLNDLASYGLRPRNLRAVGDRSKIPGIGSRPWAPFSRNQGEQMTRERNKHRVPEPPAIERSTQTDSRAGDRLAFGSTSQVRRPCCLLVVSGLLLLAVITIFGQTARHGFINFDNDRYVYENPHLRRGPSGAGIAWAFTAYHSANWHPLTWLSHMLDYQFYARIPLAII